MIALFACLPPVAVATAIARGCGKAWHELRVLRMQARYSRYLDALACEQKGQR